jgi:HAD superfamily hydrolase (TIGR01662 family)
MMKPERRFEAVLFDLGDTLIYFDGNWADVFRQAELKLMRSLRGSGVGVEDEFLEVFSGRMEAYFHERESEFIEHTSFAILKNTLQDFGYSEIQESTIKQALAAMYSITQEHWIPEDDAIATLTELQNAGYRLALISNAADDPNTQFLVDKLGARHFFEVVISSAALGIRKPDPQIFHSVLSEMDLAPGNAVMVGDSLGADILGARNAGVYSIWLTRRAGNSANRAYKDKIVPDSCIPSLSELPDLLRRLEHEI